MQMHPRNCREFPAFQAGPAAFYSRAVLPPARLPEAPAASRELQSRPHNYVRCMPRMDMVVGVSQSTLFWPPSVTHG